VLKVCARGTDVLQTYKLAEKMISADLRASTTLGMATGIDCNHVEPCEKLPSVGVRGVGCHTQTYAVISLHPQSHNNKGSVASFPLSYSN